MKWDYKNSIIRVGLVQSGRNHQQTDCKLVRSHHDIAKRMAHCCIWE